MMVDIESRREASRRYRQRNLAVLKERNKEYSLTHNNKHKEEKSAKRKHDYRANITAWMCKAAKQRAKKACVPYDIVPSDIIIPDVCPVLGIPLMIADGTHTDNSPSLDRVIPELGYVPGNIVVISRRANTIKNCGTADEHIQIANYIQKQLGTLAGPNK